MRIIDSNTEVTKELLKEIRKDEDGANHRIYRWEVSATIDVQGNWVMDGFDLTPERLQQILKDALEADLSFSYETETGVSNCIVESAPDLCLIRAEQGYPDEVCPLCEITTLNATGHCFSCDKPI